MCCQKIIKCVFILYNVVDITSGLNISDFKPQIKIVGGNKARIGQFPYQVSLRSATRFKSSLGHFCGGSIINDTHVLTAAHCLYRQDPGDLYVVAGALKLSDRGQQRWVKTYSLHGLYSENSFQYDIGIIRLFTPFEFNNYTVKAVGLGVTKPAAGTMCTVSGWGQTVENNATIPNNLRYVSVPISDWASCVRNYSKAGNVIPDIRMLCAGFPSGGMDACNGDSGGPLVCRGSLAGVVSWGAGCANRNLPGVYTDVASYNAWILANSGTIISIEWQGLQVFVILGYVALYLIKIG